MSAADTHSSSPKDEARPVAPPRTPSPIPLTAWASLVAILLGALVVQLDSTVVAIANPVIAAELGATLGQIAWVSNIYLLVMAGLMIPAGALADRVGHKRIFLIGIGGFAAASLLCGLSDSIELLVLARGVQGVFGAMIPPAGLAILRLAFPQDRVPLAFGVFGALAAVATAGGPILGGVLIQYASWNWAFLVNVPFGLLVVGVGVLAIRESDSLTKARLDLPGALLLTLSIAALTWALNGAPEHGWVSVRTLGFGLVGLVLLAVFVRVERKAESPMLPIALFRDRSFSIGVILTITTLMAFFALLFYLTFYLQGVRGESALGTAVALLPMTVILTVASPLAGVLLAKIGLRALLLIGTGSFAAGLLMLRDLDVDSGWGILVPAVVLAGLGDGLLAVGAMHAVVGNAPEGKAGAASGVQQAAQSVGGTLGISLFSTVLATAVASRFAPVLMASGTPSSASALSRLGADPDLVGQASQGFGAAAQSALSDRLIASGMSAQNAENLVDAVTLAAHESFVGGLHAVFLTAAIIVLSGGVLALFVRRPSGEAAHAEAPVL